MSFEDLPPGRARELPLTDHTHAADVVDLMTFEADRAAGCVSAMICDEQARGLQPVVVKDLPVGSPQDAMVQILRVVLPLVAARGGSLLLARGRPGPSRASDEDRDWHQRAIELCREHEVRLLGFHVATAHGVLRLPDPLDSADEIDAVA